MEKKLIFVVEDEKNIGELIKFNLEDNGYDVQVYRDGESMLEACNKEYPCLFILDIMLPGMDGIEVCKKLRRSDSYKQTPIIMLSAKIEEIDKIIGLELGADDYITKPFSVRELVTRVKVALRRQVNTLPEKNHQIIRFGAIKVDFDSRQVYKNDSIVDLTYKEFELMKLLINNKGKVLSRESVLDSIWGMDYDGGTRTVDVHIRYLRQKLEIDDNHPEHFETVRGVGYRFNHKEINV